MSWSVFITGSVEIRKDIPKDLQKLILEEIEEVCEVKFLRRDLESIFESLIKNIKNILANYNFSDNLDLDEIKKAIIEEVERTFSELEPSKGKYFSVEEVVWSSHVNDDEIDYTLNIFDVFLFDGYISVYWLDEYSGKSSCSVNGSDINKSWEECLEEFIRKERNLKHNLISIILKNKRKLSDETIRKILEVIKRADKELYLKILSGDYDER